VLEALLDQMQKTESLVALTDEINQLPLLELIQESLTVGNSF
jgi:hypothetical protein